MIGLDLALTLAATRLEVCSDSQLIIEKIQKEYEAKDERMTHYLTLVEACLGKLGKLAVKRVPQIKNLKVDALAEIVVTLFIREVVMLPVYVHGKSLVVPVPVCSSTKANLG